MKLGKGTINFRIKFQNLATNRISIKNVYAQSEQEAILLFTDYYRDFEVKILSIEIIEN